MKSGSETIHITGAGQLPYALEKEKKLNEALNRLSSEGKRVINTIDGPQSVGPLGILIGSVTILWEIDDAPKTVTPAIIQNVASTNEPKRNIIINENNLSASVLRANMFLQDQDWSTAMDYFNGILDIDPTNADAYIGCFCAEQKIKEIDELASIKTSMRNNGYIQKIQRFGNDELKEKIEDLLKKNSEATNARINTERLQAEVKKQIEARQAEKLKKSREIHYEMGEIEKEIKSFEKKLKRAEKSKIIANLCVGIGVFIYGILISKPCYAAGVAFLTFLHICIASIFLIIGILGLVDKISKRDIEYMERIKEDNKKLTNLKSQL